jgi:hypothetical protein
MKSPPDLGTTFFELSVSDVKARLYPLTKFTKFLEWLIERLPRDLIAIQIIPQNNVIIINEKSGEYKALSEDPSFLLAMQPQLKRGGWFYLEAALVRHTGDREARLFGRGGRSGDEAFDIPIPSNLRGTVREVFYLPGPVTNVFWSPMRAPGFFSQSPLLIHRISTVESYLRRAHRVVLTLWSLRGG